MCDCQFECIFHLEGSLGEIEVCFAWKCLIVPVGEYILHKHLRLFHTNER